MRASHLKRGVSALRLPIRELIVLLSRFVTAGRSAGALVAAVALALSGCGADGFDPQQWNAPGQNEKVGSVLIRYAHIAEPRGKPWKQGDDVPAYMWLYNKAG